MAFAQATFEVHQLFQHLTPFPLPYTITPGNLMIWNPQFRRLRYRIPRYFADFWIAVIAFISVYRSIWLYKNYEQYTYKHMSQVVVYVLINGAVAIYISFFYTYRKDLSSLLYTRNQMLALQPQIRISRSFVNLIKKLVVYGIMFGGALTAVATPIATFILAYDPLQLVFGVSTKSRILVSGIYLIVSSRAATALVSPLLLCLTFLEGAIGYSAQLSIDNRKQMSPEILRQFYKHFGRYEILRLLLFAGAKACEVMYTSLIFVGIFMISVSGFGMLQLYEELPLLVYVPVSFVFALGIFIATVFTALASLPCENVKKFCKTWKRVVKRELGRKLLKSVPVIGFMLGPYGLATKTLGLLICEDIMNNVLDLMLMDQF